MTDAADEPTEAAPFVPPPMILYAVTSSVPMRPAWRRLRVEDDVHIVPVADVVEHRVPADEDDAAECVCGPTRSLVDCPLDHDHPDLWLHQHHALDGRDLPRLR